MPKVGNFVEFEFRSSKNGLVSGRNSSEFLAFDQNSRRFFVKRIFEVNGHSEHFTEWQDEGSYRHDNALEVIMKDCLSLGGNYETLSVPAGVFLSCAITSDSELTRSTTWYARVPLEVVQSESYAFNGSFYSFSRLKMAR